MPPLLAQVKRASNLFPLSRTEKPPPMLVPSGRPLQFRLPDSRAQETALAEFLGRCRIVLAFNPDRGFFDSLLTVREGLDERNMVVLVIVPPDHSLLSAPTSTPVFTLTDDGGQVALAYGAPADGPFFCLIGKDGTVKRAARDLPTPDELFAAVDAMPMRRQEMQDRDRPGRG